jgi:hypothetical protein
MHQFAFIPGSRRVFGIMLLTLVTGAAWAQPGPAQAPSASASDTKLLDELLVKTAKLYYSTRAAGLDGFDCDVHPDWPALFSSANKGAAVDENDPHVASLKSVKIALHAHMGGGSTVDWKPPANPDKPLDANSTAMLEQLHAATEQTLKGFLQFWTPFVDGSVVPQSSEGLKFTHSATDWTLHGEQNGTEVTEIFSNESILQHFDVVTGGMSIQFVPSYKPTENGLLVNRFDAHIQPVGQASAHVQDMHVEVVYATIDGVPIPSKLNVEVTGTGTFNMAMDGCRTSRKSSGQ